LQQNKLQQANLMRNVTIGGILALFIIVFLLFRQYRHKQQSNILISQKNEVLQHLLNEKEWLLKEVHHRVKNNLHTVICLLESQAAYLENDALKAIENSQHRIYAMSLIHQKLYQSDDVKTIDMSIYLPEFVQYLNDGFGTQRQIRFQLAIEPLMLGLSQAIPIALIINESVTNSIKYAFPENRNGIIEINMHQIKGRIRLVIADNGIGINPEIANNPTDSLGLKLINGLSEDINATINFVNDNGTRITIMFNFDPLNDSNNLSTKIKEKEVYS
jgi:two-component sensor histidine kinase